jgi:hypothetical protein
LYVRVVRHCGGGSVLLDAGDPDEFEVVRRDLEEVVLGEVRELLSMVDCPAVKVAEDALYFAFHLEHPEPDKVPVKLPRLPIVVTYIPKHHVTVLEFKVEFYAGRGAVLDLSTVRYYFILTPTSTTCFKDYTLNPANIETATKIILGGSEES